MKKPNTLLKVVSILYIVFNIIGGILVFATMSSDEFKDASLFHKKGRKCRTGFFHPHVILPPPPKVAQGVVTMQVPALWC